MTDIFDPEKRSEVMSRIRGRDTKPEMIVRRIAHGLGFRFRLHRRDLPGSPDLVFPKHRAVIMVHGCFWHRHPGCRYATSPKTRVRFWEEKFEGNVVRDRRNEDALDELGWRVLVIWECETRDREAVAERIVGVSGRWGGRLILVQPGALLPHDFHRRQVRRASARCPSMWSPMTVASRTGTALPICRAFESGCRKNGSPSGTSEGRRPHGR